MADTARIIAFGDLHAPLTHAPYFDWLLGQIEDFRPHYVVNVGDWFEALAAKRWARYPDEKWTAQDEVQAVVAQAAAINAVAPDARKVWLYGNHDDNLFGCHPDRIPVDLREIVNWRMMRGTEALESWEEKTTYTHGFRFRLGPVTFQHGCDVSKDGLRAMFGSAILYSSQNGLLVQGHSHKPVHPQECEIRSLPTRFWVANAGCGCEWDRMHYMDRFQKAKWGRGCLLIETSASACKVGNTAFARKAWDAELRIHSLARG